MTGTCLRCGATFSRNRPRDHKKDAFKYCSRACAFAAGATSRPLEPRVAAWPPIRIGPLCEFHYATCTECARLFITRASATRCSPECATVANRRRSRGRYHRQQEPLPPVQRCPSCHQDFTPWRRALIFCSQRCSKGFQRTRARIIGGTGIRLRDLPEPLIALLRTYRRFNQEVNAFNGGHNAQ